MQGVFANGNVVAVKQLHMKTAGSLDEFSNEVVLITGMKHRNLVNLKGCCLREHQRLLVYEYVDNSDVEQIFFGNSITHPAQVTYSL
jgi:serine/threonine protein kinase